MFYHNVVQLDVVQGKSISCYTPPFTVIVWSVPGLVPSYTSAARDRDMAKELLHQG